MAVKLIYQMFAKLLTWMVLHAPLRRRAMGCRPNGLIHIQQVRSFERFNRTLLDEWAYAHPYATETRRRAALPDYN